MAAAKLKEIAVRENTGLTVRMFWRPKATEDELALVIEVEGYGATHSFEAPIHDADLAFNHPFAYNHDLPDPFAREDSGWLPAVVVEVDPKPAPEDLLEDAIKGTKPDDEEGGEEAPVGGKK